MITSGNRVKILDFGLAKAGTAETQRIDSLQSPTIEEMKTSSGVILGTAAYMSPEQAKGKPVDRRTDIWVVDLDGTSAIGNLEPMAVVHNPKAANSIPKQFLPAHAEYEATPIGTEEYVINRIKGNLAS